MSRTVLAACLLSLTAAVWARPSATVKMAVSRVENAGSIGQKVLLPYAFSTEGMGFAAGAGGVRKGFYQDQMAVGATAYAGPETRGGGLGLWDLRFPGTDRLFISAYGMMGYYPRQRAYAAPRDWYWPAQLPRPGSNDSPPELALESSGASNWWEVQLAYALPIGATEDRGMIPYRLAQGILVSEPSGGDHWNPLDSGATVLLLRQYNRYQTFELEQQTLSGAVHAWELGILYDNTDFPLNPSRGSSQYLAVHYDAAWLDSQQQWLFLELEASKYFSLGASPRALQRVIALNAWTGYSPSWKLQYNDEGGSRVEHAPPYMEGAALGGFYRLRGYDQYRFHDKAALYVTAEYRYTLRWNPLRDVSWLRFLAADWLQAVAFAEGGRVGAGYTAAELLTDWRSDWGLALRGMFGGLVVRLDWAHSTEGSNLWAMVNHPF